MLERDGKTDTTLSLGAEAATAISVRRVVYSEANGRAGWWIKPRVAQSEDVLARAWLVSVYGENGARRRVVYALYATAYHRANEHLAELGHRRAFPAVPDDWSYDISTNRLESLPSACVAL